MGGWVYIIQTASPLPVTNASLYLGSTTDLEKRFQQHLGGKGSPMLRRATELGIGFEIICAYRTRSERGARELEAKFKRWKNNALALEALETLNAMKREKRRTCNGHQRTD